MDVEFFSIIYTVIIYIIRYASTHYHVSFFESFFLIYLLYYIIYTTSSALFCYFLLSFSFIHLAILFFVFLWFPFHHREEMLFIIYS